MSEMEILERREREGRLSEDDEVRLAQLRRYRDSDEPDAHPDAQMTTEVKK